MSNVNVVVTGTNRGLGLEFCKQWIARGAQVHALARDPDSAKELQELAAAHADQLVVSKMDVADDASVHAACEAIAKRWDRVDVLVNNAGVYGKGGTSIESLDLDEVVQVMNVNTLGPLRMTRVMLPLMRKAKGARVANITSLMGSITDNTSGSTWAYRMSKAALNMASRNLSHELSSEGITVVTMHPGWVRTDMGGAGAPLAVDDAVASMTRTIDTLQPTDSGRFIDRNGETLPW